MFTGCVTIFRHIFFHHRNKNTNDYKSRQHLFDNHRQTRRENIMLEHVSLGHRLVGTVQRRRRQVHIFFYTVYIQQNDQYRRRKEENSYSNDIAISLLFFFFYFFLRSPPPCNNNSLLPKRTECSVHRIYMYTLGSLP